MDEFQGAVTTFLAEGAARSERLILVADDPNPHVWPREMLSTGALLVASTAEIYGPERIVDAATLRDRFSQVVREALDDGYSGVRLAADNTSLVSDGPRLAAWREWEDLSDRFMEDNPLTGLCAFDRSRTDPDQIRLLEKLHQRSFGF